MAKQQTTSLYDFSLEQLKDRLVAWGEAGYRAEQIYRHIYHRLCPDIGLMSDVPAHLRERLKAECLPGTLKLMTVHSADQGWTRKALFHRGNGKPVESVLMIYSDRATVCVSTQSGCPIRCLFCATGQLGFLGDLSSGEMIEQVLWAARELKALNPRRAITNVVYMGMGEPFLNYDAWWESVVRLNDPKGFGLGARSFTVSTVGVVPGILRLAEAPLQINLALSLHAASDPLRTRLVPLNKKYPLAEILKALRYYTSQTHRRVSLEYVLLHGINDDITHARELADWCCGRFDGLGRLLCHVNLIPWNHVPHLPLQTTAKDRVLRFKRVLETAHIPCTVRVQRGQEIGAACGQLAGVSGQTSSFRLPTRRR